MGKKITQLATITEVADDDLIVGVDVSDTSGSENGTNKKFTKATLLGGLAPLNPQLTGWNPDTETWVYHNVDDPTGYIKIEDKDVSANYSVGWRIMFTNGGNVIKGIITAITFTDPDTIITFLHEIDPTDNQALYLLTNSTITENYFSPHKAPLGFPMSPEKWKVENINTSNNEGAMSSKVWYNRGGSLVVPIGAWRIFYRCLVGGYRTGTNISFSTTLSTSSSAESDKRFTTLFSFEAPNGILSSRDIGSSERILAITSPTQYYLNVSSSSGASSGGLFGAEVPSVITATCAYL